MFRGLMSERGQQGILGMMDIIRMVLILVQRVGECNQIIGHWNYGGIFQGLVQGLPIQSLNRTVACLHNIKVGILEILERMRTFMSIYKSLSLPLLGCILILKKFMSWVFG